MGLSRLKRFTSLSPDRMVPFVLKRVKNSIIQNLVKIFNYSIENRYVPIDWKSANVVPVYKKGDKKAFDTVPHKRLIVKIRALGIRENIAGWIEDWLKNKRQRVVINRECSKWIKINSGVPQGSVLETLLFIIYINEPKMGSRVDSKEHVINIQTDLDKMV